MSGSIIQGGKYFTDGRINLIQGAQEVDWRHLVDGRVPEVGDWVFFLGIKTWVRRLKKARYSYPQIADKLAEYILKVAGKRPYGVLDDCNWDDEDKVGDRLRRQIKPRVYLLREYMDNREYPENTHPFSIPSDDLGEYRTTPDISISFYGDDSHRDRNKWVRRFERVYGSVLKVYKGGEKSSDKLPREEYLAMIGRSSIALSFRGHGHCCFRYQEIPAVGACLATPESHHVVRNDYQDRKHCIRFATADYVVDMEQVEDIAAAGHEHFLKYHTTEVRHNELMEYIDEVRGNKSL